MGVLSGSMLSCLQSVIRSKADSFLLMARQLGNWIHATLSMTQLRSQRHSE